MICLRWMLMGGAVSRRREAAARRRLNNTAQHDADGHDVFGALQPPSPSRASLAGATLAILNGSLASSMRVAALHVADTDVGLWRDGNAHALVFFFWPGISGLCAGLQTRCLSFGVAAFFRFGFLKDDATLQTDRRGPRGLQDGRDRGGAGVTLGRGTARAALGGVPRSDHREAGSNRSLARMDCVARSRMIKNRRASTRNERRTVAAR